MILLSVLLTPFCFFEFIILTFFCWLFDFLKTLFFVVIYVALLAEKSLDWRKDPKLKDFNEFFFQTKWSNIYMPSVVFIDFKKIKKFERWLNKWKTEDKFPSWTVAFLAYYCLPSQLFLASLLTSRLHKLKTFKILPISHVDPFGCFNKIPLCYDAWKLIFQCLKISRFETHTEHHSILYQFSSFWFF